MFWLLGSYQITNILSYTVLSVLLRKCSVENNCVMGTIYFPVLALKGEVSSQVPNKLRGVNSEIVDFGRHLC